ncbi:alpha/beta hydrolase [Embleya sp. NPDC005971]|uniref:RBBP9/YdeN family alpha/beta hydrolase n=1 Tax=Embleya sp. NPDC005971 TaxID=3156724 RepID=UPI0033F3A73C
MRAHGPALDHDLLDRAARVAALDDVLAQVRGPVLLAAHSAGVLTTVHWARRYRTGERFFVQGALPATPPDFGTPLPPGYPTPDALEQHGWTPVPHTRLPFPRIVAASSDDPLASAERVAESARAWGSRLVELGPVGHLNPAAGFGPWPRAQSLLRAAAG